MLAWRGCFLFEALASHTCVWLYKSQVSAVQKYARANTAISHVANLLTHRSMSLWFPILYLVHAH